MTVPAELEPPAQLPAAPVSVERDLSWTVSRHARRLFSLALVGLGLAVATRRPELVAVAAPALVLLCAGRGPRPRTARVALRPSATRVFEGEQVSVEVTISGHGDHSVEFVCHPAEGVQAVKGRDRAASDQATVAFEVSLWGQRQPGILEVVLWDRCRLFECHTFVALPQVACYPMPARHRRAGVLGRLANRAGDHVARSQGDGVEFAGVRQYAAGDRQRSINWAATTRRGRLQVNTFAAERSQDVVLIVDATSDIGKLGATPVDYALRGALGVARTYLDARDRVGLVFFGTYRRWLAPGLGDKQFFRLAEAVVACRPGWSRDIDITRLPRAALPPGAAVIAFSPLLDAHFVEALRDLRQRNFSVAVVDLLVSPPSAGRDRLDRLAERILLMEREAVRFSLRELGVTVARWDGRDELALPLEKRGARGRWGHR